MNIRLIDWRDLPVLCRYRHQCMFFDSTLALTRGSSLDWTKAILSSMAPTTGLFTYLAVEDSKAEPPVLGQATLPPGALSARLTCLAPKNALEFTALASLLDFIVTQLGERGAFHVLAEADECDLACEIFHENGFAVYARQRIWQLNEEPIGSAVPTPWRTCTDQDVINIRSLFNNLTPGLVQQVEPLATQRPHGMVYYQGQDLLAYVDLKSGPNGIWIQPFIHPNVENVTARLVSLLQNLPNRNPRPVYLCVRSYQEWLAASVEALGAKPGPRQAVMVKRLALSRRVVQPTTLPVLEGKQAEPTVPIIQVKRTWFMKK